MQVPQGLAPYFTEGVQAMMKPNVRIANMSIERILELSADAHVQRRGTVQGSAEFNKLTGAIAAYGKALELLTALQRWEDLRANQRAA